MNAKELPLQAFLKLGHATCLDSKLHPLLNMKHAIQGQVAIHKICRNELRFLLRFISKIDTRHFVALSFVLFCFESRHESHVL